VQPSDFGLSAKLGAVDTMTAYVDCGASDYLVAVVPGRHWQEGGFGDQNNGGPGVTVIPPLSTVKEWLDVMLTGQAGGPRNQDGFYEGGWWLDRSLCVKWALNDDLTYYRSGDDKKYDLAKKFPDQVGIVTDDMLDEYKANVCAAFCALTEQAFKKGIKMKAWYKKKKEALDYVEKLQDKQFKSGGVKRKRSIAKGCKSGGPSPKLEKDQAQTNCKCELYGDEGSQM
jgi:hypothetical protein